MALEKLQIPNITDPNPELMGFLSTICDTINWQKIEIDSLKKEVHYLRDKDNENERYLSKDSIIFCNLRLLSNQSVKKDVVDFIYKAMCISMVDSQLVACHELSRIVNTADPPPIIAKFIHFDLKKRYGILRDCWEDKKTR